MKSTFIICTLVAGSSFAGAQSMLPANDPSLINLETPSLLGKSKTSASVDLRYFGGYDKTLHGSLWIGYGICHNFELDLAGSFSKWNSMSTPGGDEIRFGGTDEEVSLRYALPASIPITVQGGLAYVQTPAQAHRLATTLGASAGYSPAHQVRFYLNPRAVFLSHNSLVGIGIGTEVDLAPKISLIGDWTPLATGDNTLDTQSANRCKAQLYSAGLRFTSLIPDGTLDIGVTNSSGLTTGSSLTPGLGGAPAIFARFTYRF